MMDLDLGRKNRQGNGGYNLVASGQLVVAMS